MKGWRLAAIILSILAALALVGLGALLVVKGRSASATKSPSGTVMACVPSGGFAAIETDAEKQERITCPPKGARYLDGLVVKATDDGFDLLTLPDRRQVFIPIRKPDRPFIDVQHAQTHASLGQPVRVFLLPYKEEDVLVYMEDSAVAY